MRKYVHYYLVEISGVDPFGSKVFTKTLSLTDWIPREATDYAIDKLKTEFTKTRQHYINKGDIEDGRSNPSNPQESREQADDQTTQRR